MPRRAPARSSRPRGRASVDFGEFRETAETVWRAPTKAFEPAYSWTEAMHEDVRAIERADHDLTRLSPSRETLLQRVRREALARNAFATASIEGNPLTLDDVQSLLRANPSPASIHDKDEIEILNYAAFMRSAPARRAPRTPADVRAVHAALFRDVLPDAGSWKKAPNFIGRRADGVVIYVPTAPEHVERELATALEWLHDARDHHPILRAVLLHHEFESIHPFRDGNGRTGRALTPMALTELGYPGCSYAQIDYHIYRTRSEYYAELAAVERGGFQDYTKWAAYMLRVVRAAYADAVELSRFERALPRGLADRQVRLAEWFGALAREAPERRVKFNDVHHAFPEIAERTLKRDLAALRDASVIDAEGERKGTTYRLRPPD